MTLPKFESKTKLTFTIKEIRETVFTEEFEIPPELVGKNFKFAGVKAGQNQIMLIGNDPITKNNHDCWISYDFNQRFNAETKSRPMSKDINVRISNTERS